MPYESGITGDGFAPGKTLLLFGTPEKKGKRFHINLVSKNIKKRNFNNFSAEKERRHCIALQPALWRKGNSHRQIDFYSFIDEFLTIYHNQLGFKNIQNPTFKAIVRNSLIANEWGNEEREGKIPLEKGIGFDLKIINEEYAFQVGIFTQIWDKFFFELTPDKS